MPIIYQSGVVAKPYNREEWGKPLVRICTDCGNVNDQKMATVCRECASKSSKTGK